MTTTSLIIVLLATWTHGAVFGYVITNLWYDPQVRKKTKSSKNQKDRTAKGES